MHLSSGLIAELNLQNQMIHQNYMFIPKVYFQFNYFYNVTPKYFKVIINILYSVGYFMWPEITRVLSSSAMISGHLCIDIYITYYRTTALIMSQ